MLQIDQTCPSVNLKCKEGSVVVRQMQRKFSALVIDQGHEQNNKLVKGRCNKIITNLNAWFIRLNCYQRAVKFFWLNKTVIYNHLQQEAVRFGYFTLSL